MAELVGAVTLTSLLSLSALDIPCESLTRLQVALEGDKHMAVASRTTTGQEICIIDIPAKRYGGVVGMIAIFIAKTMRWEK